jgi:hypothetical protein
MNDKLADNGLRMSLSSWPATHRFLLTWPFATVVTKIQRLAQPVDPAYLVDPAYFPLS